TSGGRPATGRTTMPPRSTGSSSGLSSSLNSGWNGRGRFPHPARTSISAAAKILLRKAAHQHDEQREGQHEEEVGHPASRLQRDGRQGTAIVLFAALAGAPVAEETLFATGIVGQIVDLLHAGLRQFAGDEAAQIEHVFRLALRGGARARREQR